MKLKIEKIELFQSQRYKQFLKNLQGKVIDISKIIATQTDVNYFNILYGGHVRIKLV